MGILNGQAVSQEITNPAFINKNINDVMPNILGFARALSGASIADIQAAVNKLYTATGASEFVTGTVYNATPGTITNGVNYQDSLTTLAGKFDPATGHFHTGTAGDGPLLNVVRSIAAATGSPVTGDVVFYGANQIGNSFYFGGGGGGSGIVSAAVTGNAPATGALVFVPGPNISITQYGAEFTFSAATGSGVVQSFTLVNNQTTFANVTGFYVNPASSQSFVATTTTTRQHPNSITVTGSEDESFYNNLTSTGDNSGLNEKVLAFGELTDGSVILGGQFTDLNGTTTNRIFKTDVDGDIDTTFQTNIGTAFNDEVQIIAVQVDDKIIVGGSFTSFNGSTRNRLIRLNDDGTEDTTFYTNLTSTGDGSAFDSSITALGIDSSGKISVGGSFSNYNGASRPNILRLNSNGTPDTTFNGNLVTYGQIEKLSVQTDSKIVVVGNFTTPTARVARINSDGTSDTTFNTNVGTGANDTVFGVRIQSDGKIVAVGIFTTFNGNGVPNLIRINTNGTADTAFTTAIGTSTSEGLFHVSIISSGEMILGGLVTTFNGMSTPAYIYALNSDGTPNTALNNGFGSGFSVNTLRSYAESDDKVLIGGGFTMFKGITRNYIIRYNTVETLINDYMSSDRIVGNYYASTNTWELFNAPTLGDDTGVELQMTNLGQMQYKTTSLPGSPIVSQIKFNIEAI